MGDIKELFTKTSSEDEEDEYLSELTNELDETSASLKERLKQNALEDARIEAERNDSRNKKFIKRMSRSGAKELAKVK